MRGYWIFTLQFLFSVFSHSQVFKPSDLGGLRLWLDSDTGITLNGTLVSQWNDLSGNGNHAFQASVPSQPAFVTSVSTIKNHPVVHFDGTAPYMEFPEIADIRTVFWIIKEDPGATSNYRALLGHAVKYDFLRGDNKEFWRTASGNPFVLSGVTRLGPNVVDGTTTLVPPQYSLISLITVGNVSAANFSWDQNFGTRFWEGDLAELIIYNQPLSDSDRLKVEQYLIDKYAPPVNLGADILVNYGFCPVTINAHQDWFDGYLWNTGATADSIVITKAGQYSISATDIFGYTSSDTINLTYPGNLSPFPAAVTLCAGDTLVWNTNLDKTGYSFLWQDNSTDSAFKITQAGQYHVTVTDTIGVSGCSVNSYTVNVSLDVFPQTASLGPDVTACSGASIALVSGAGQATSYLWSTGSSASSIVVTSSGTYSVTVQNANGCVAQDTINVTISGTAPFMNFSFDTVCLGDSTGFTDLSTSGNGITNWNWSFGDATGSALKNPKHLYASAGTYLVALTVTTSVGCTNTISRNVLVNSNPAAEFSSTQPMCKEDSMWFSDLSTTSSGTIAGWLWDFGDPLSGSNISNQQNPIHPFSSLGGFTVKLVSTSSAGCKDSMQKNVQIVANDCTLPSQIGGLRLWLAADSGVVQSGGAVSQWKDMSGNGNDATQAVLPSRPGYISSVVEINDRPAIHFDGTAPYLVFSEITDIRTVFWVIKEDPLATGNNRALLGHATKFDFLRGDNKEFWRIPSGNPFVLSGVTRLGPNVIDGTMDTVPGRFSLISLVTTGDVSASNFSWDQNFGARFWDGNLSELIIYNQPLPDSSRLEVEAYLRFKYAPPVNLGEDIVMVSACDTVLDPGARFISFKWNGSSADTGQTFTVNKQGKYWVDVVDVFGFASSDTVVVSYPGNFKPFPDTTICYGTSVKWNTQLNKVQYDFLWQDSSTDSVFTITQAGKYHVKVTDTLGCIRFSDTINVAVDSFPITTTLGNDTSVCAGASIGLVAGAAQATSYFWSTGSTASSIAISATGAFSLTVQDANGCTAKDTINVNIKGIKPVPDFTVSPVCQGFTSSFQDISAAAPPDSISSWAWNFGEGGASSVQHPTHTYTAAGTFTATLTVVTDSGCTDAVQKLVRVNAKPNADFTLTKPCSVGLTYFLDATSITNDTLSGWSWNFGDPSSSANTASTKNATHNFSSAGTFSVQLIATSVKGCKDTIVKIISVLPSPAVSFTATSVCFGGITSFAGTSSSPSNYLWNFGDGSPANNTLQNPTHPYSAPGTYTVIFTATASNGCFNKDTGTVAVYNLPKAGFSAAGPLCMDNILQFTDTSKVTGSAITGWSWNFGPPGTSSVQNPAVTYTSSGTYTVSLFVTSAQTCTASASHTVTVHPLPDPGFTFSPHYGSPPLSVSFTNTTSGATGYQWVFGDGGLSSGLDVSHVYLDTGTYVVRLTAQNQFGCVDSVVPDTVFVVAPLLDVAVVGVTGLEQSGVLDVYATLYNAGTLFDTTIELSVWVDGGIPVHETWKGQLRSKETVVYRFNSSFELQPGHSRSIVCVEIKEVNGKADDVLSNNKKCSSITDDFILLNPYPNPVIGEINFLFVSPEVTAVKAQLYDVRGRLIAGLFEGEAMKGLNQVVYDASSLQKGVYVFRLTYKGENIARMFLKK